MLGSFYPWNGGSADSDARRLQCQQSVSRRSGRPERRAGRRGLRARCPAGRLVDRAAVAGCGRKAAAAGRPAKSSRAVKHGARPKGKAEPVAAASDSDWQSGPP